MILPPAPASPPTGWLQDAPDARDWGFAGSKIHTLRPLPGATSGTIDYRHLDSPRVQIANSCVGHALAASMFLCMAIAGTPIAFPSPQWLYSGARILERGPALLDRGCYPRHAMTWARDRGSIAETRWPESGANINAIPPMDAWQEGDAATLKAFYRIADGEGASDAVTVALSRGYCPFFAMQVDERYEEIGRAVYDGPGGAVIGGHAQAIVGVIDALDALIVRSTWGAAHGDGGYVYMSRRAFDAMARDVWVVQAAPEVG